MNDLLGLVLFAGAGVAGFALLWWLLISTEGVYLGRRVVIWLYDLYANRYDSIKNYQPDYERWLLANPLLGAIHPHVSPLVLDIATGTGRLPIALLNHPEFQGRIVAVDLSRRMLALAAQKLHDDLNRVSLLWCAAERLPFPDSTFDIVTCLEALEFMSSPTQVLKTLLRVLRPGGLLLISSRINTQVMPGKTWADDEIKRLLINLGAKHVEIEVWQLDYHKVWALKAGESYPVGARPLEEILRCPRCEKALMTRHEKHWSCENCAAKAPIAADRVIELQSLYTSKS